MGNYIFIKYGISALCVFCPFHSVPKSILGGTTRNPRRCILRGFNFLILLQLRFARPRVRGGPGTSYRFLRHRFVKVRGILKKFNTFEVGAVLVTPDGLDLNLPGTGKAVLPAHHYKAMLD